MEWEARFHESLGSLRNLEIGLGGDRYQLLVTGSYGDVFPNLALLNSFYSEYKTPIVVLLPESYASLARRFDYPYVQYVLVKGESIGRLHALLCSSGRPFIRSPGYLFPVLPTLHPWVADFVLSERVTDYECKRQLLGLPVGAPFDLPALATSRTAELLDSLKNENIESGGSAMLSFHSQSNPVISLEAQLLIIKKLISNKIQVVMNTASSAALLETYKRVFSELPLKYFDIPCDAPVEVVNYAGRYIGGAHGLTVILGSFISSAKLIQVEQPDGGLIRNNGRFITGESLNVARVLRGDLRNLFDFIPGNLELLKSAINRLDSF